MGGILETAALIVGEILFQSGRVGLETLPAGKQYILRIHNGELSPEHEKLRIESPAYAETVAKALACLMAIAFNRDKEWILRIYPKIHEGSEGQRYIFALPIQDLGTVRLLFDEIQATAKAMLDTLPGDPKYAKKEDVCTFSFNEKNCAAAFGRLVTVLANHHEVAFNTVNKGELSIRLPKITEGVKDEPYLVRVNQRLLADIMVADQVLDKPVKHLTEEQREKVIVDSLMLLRKEVEKQRPPGFSPEWY